MNREQLRSRLHQYGLSNIAETLLERAQDAIALHLTPADHRLLPLGDSMVGGAPDVPNDFSWPERAGRSLDFLTQISCAEAAPYDPTGLLPPDGWLLFFYDLQEQPWGYEVEDAGGWAVQFLVSSELPGSGRSQHAQAAPPIPLMPTRVTFSRETTIPSLLASEASGLHFPYEAEVPEGAPSYADMLNDDYDQFGPRHQMFGHAFVLQDDMRVGCQERFDALYPDEKDASLPEDWLLLLQLDTDDMIGTNWGDAGLLYYWIRRQDLMRADFARVWLILQCY